MAQMAHVLVVDDDEPIRESLRFLLEDAGHTVRESEDGAGALVALRGAEAPYVVLLDLMMPNMSGSQLLQIIAQEPTLQTRHAYILLTANVRMMAPTIDGIPEDFANTLVLLHKPFENDLLLFVVDQVGQRLDARA